jgi:hypothetical protein
MSSQIPTHPKAPTLVTISLACRRRRHRRHHLGFSPHRRIRFRPPALPPTAATMQAAAWRRHLLDQHLSPASSTAIAALRSGSVPGLIPQGSYHPPPARVPLRMDLSGRVGLDAGLCGADGARYMASARAPAVKGSGHLVRKGTGGRSSVRWELSSSSSN